MDKQEAEKRIEVLRHEIDRNRYLYHVLDHPRVSDAVDDSLKRELSELENQYPDLITPESPTQRVGGKPLDKFKKVTHSTPMLSLNDIFSADDLVSWEQRIAKLVSEAKIKSSGFYAELKMDGLAVTLIYKDGMFVRGATRGDGKVGEDVTQNLKTIESIPLKLVGAPKGEIEIRGEIYLGKKDFEALNAQQKKKGGQVFANPRNIAAGSIRQLDPKIASGRNLKFMMYAIITDIGLHNHNEEHELAQKWGFQANAKINRLCKNTDEIVDFFNHLQKERSKLPYQIDGMVVGVNDKKLFTRLGVVGKAPRGQIAFKFPAEEATSLLKDIIVQVGRTGKLTPVAVLEPTPVAGSTVSRATLHNEDEIKRKDIKIGDTVIIRKAGDVIPEVVEPIKRMRTGAEKTFSMPKVCPVCGGAVERHAGEVDLYCKNKNCATVQKRGIEHFVSKGAFGIDGLGPKIIGALIEVGLVKDAADIFALHEYDLEPLERFGEKSAQNIITSIERSREVTLDRFIYSLGIRHVGAETAVDIAKQFPSIDEFIAVKEEELNRLYGIGEKVARSVAEFLSDEKNIELIKKMRSLGVRIAKYHSPIVKDKLEGKSFVVTGTLEGMSRDEAHKKIIQFGGEVNSSVSAKTNFVIAGENPGSKLANAKKFGVKVISEQEFLRMIQ